MLAAVLDFLFCEHVFFYILDLTSQIQHGVIHIFPLMGKRRRVFRAIRDTDIIHD